MVKGNRKKDKGDTMRMETDKESAEEKRRPTKLLQEERKMSAVLRVRGERAGTAFHQQDSVFWCDPMNAIPPDPWIHTPPSEKCHQDAW